MPAQRNEQTEQFIWGKLIDNVISNAIAALLQIPNEDISGHEDGWLLQKELAREACEVANAKGIPLEFDKYWSNRDESEPYDRTQVKEFHFVSAVFDSVQKRRTEMDFINGTIVREGKNFGIPTPYNETVWRLVRVMQDNYDNKYKPQE